MVMKQLLFIQRLVSRSRVIICCTLFLHDMLMAHRLILLYFCNFARTRIVMKMDIESSEFAVLPDVLFHGLLCNTINFIFGELHPWDVHYEPDRVTKRGGLNLSGRQAVNLMQSTLELFHSVKNCSGVFRVADDENYLRDGMPFPTVSSNATKLR